MAAAAAALAASQAAGAGGGETPDFDRPGAQAGIAAAQAEWAAAEARRSTPAAAREREESRTKFRDLAGDEALALASAKFPEVVDRAPWAGPVLRDGERIVRYTSDYSAQIETALGGAVVSSSVPLRANGEPVDLTLRDGERGSTPRNSAVSTKIGRSARDGMSLDGISVRLLGARDVESRAALAGRFYTGALADTDLLVTPIPGGLETFLILRSPEAPTSATLELDLPAGAALRPAPRPIDTPDAAAPDALEIARGDDVLAHIPPPVAYDAQGEPVAAHYALDGRDRITVSVETGGDLAYPILVDPAISRFGSAGSGTYDGWDPFTNGLFAHSGGAGANHVGLYPSALNWQASNAGWYVLSRNASSFVYQAQFGRLYHSGAGDGSALFTGIWNYTTDDFEPGGYQSTQAALAEGTMTVCARPGCPSSGIAPAGNEATFGLIYAGTPSGTGASVWMYSTQVFESDDNNPSAPTVSRSLSGSAWYRSGSETVTVGSSDAGLGVQSITVTPPGSSARVAAPGCGGGVGSRCPGSFSGTVGYDLAGMGNGVNTVTAVSRDPAGRSGQTSWAVRVDRADPAADVSGDGWEGTGGNVLPGERSLVVDASDTHSGVKSIDVKIDGTSLDGFPQTQSCGASGGCAMSRTARYDTADYAGGEHTIAVVVTDQAGNSWTTSNVVTFVGPPEPPDCTGSGSIPVASGHYGGAGNYVALRARQVGVEMTVVCWHVASVPLVNSAGGIAFMGASLGSGGPAVDAGQGGSCYASGGERTALTTAAGTAAISYYTRAGEAWVCVEAPFGVSYRLRLAVPSVTEPDVSAGVQAPPLTPPPPRAWPAKASNRCEALSGTFLVKQQVLDRQLFLATRKAGTTAEVCARQQTSAGLGDGGVATVEPAQVPASVGVSPDVTPCTDTLARWDDTATGSRLWLDKSPGSDPQSVCVQAGVLGGTLLAQRFIVATTGSGDPVAFTRDS